MSLRALHSALRLLGLAALLLALPAGAARADYLAQPDAFANAWARLLPRMTDRVEILSLSVEPDTIRLTARAPSGGEDLDDWQVRRAGALLGGGDMVDGPLPRRPDPEATATAFAQDAVDLPRLGLIVQKAMAAADLGPEAVPQGLQLRRAAPGGPVRLSLSVLTPRARVELLLAPEGRILRQTAEALPEPPTPPPPPPPPPDPRPAPAPPPPPALAAPTVGPMALAARALVEEVGTGRALWEVAVWGDRVTVSANATGGGRALRELRFDGSRFVPTPHGLVNTASLMGNIAFSAAEVDLAALPRVIAAAATAAGPQAGPFRRAEAKASTAAGRPMVVWRLTFGAPNAPAADLTEVVLTPDALVQRVILPEAQRPPFEGHAGPGFTRALAEILSTFPPDTRIFEIDARPDRVSIERPHPTEGGKTARSTLSPRGLRADPDFPLMMQTEADIFDLSAVAGLTAETLDRIRADAVAAVGIPGGQAVRFRIWSGAPFWRHPAGQPFLDIRIEGDNGRNGYAVFTLDGQGVAAFR